MNQEELATELGTLRRKVTQLEESETRYRMMLEIADEAVIVTQDGMVRWANPKATEMSGYSEQELLSVPFTCIIHPDDHERVMQYHMQRMRGDLDKKGYQLRILTKNGMVKWVQQSTSTISWEGRPAGLGLLTDITEQKQLDENLQRAHDELEKRVEERTTALREVNEKLHLEIAERTRAEEALRLEREQLLAIFDSIEEVISVIDSETYEILYANKFVRDRQGKEVIGGVCYKDLHGLTKPCDHCAKEIVSSLDGKPYQWDYHNPTTNRDYLATDRIIKWTDGRAAKFHLGIDVSERKKAEKALRDSEQRLELALNGADLGLWDWYVQTDHAVVNKRSAEIVGYRLDEIEPYFGFWESLLHPEDRIRAVETMYACLEGRTDHYEDEYRAKAKTGEWKWIFSQGRVVERDASGTALRMTGTYRDITARNLAEEAFRESEARYRAIFDNAAAGIILTDLYGKILKVNCASAKMLGYTEQELESLSVSDITHPDDGEVSSNNLSALIQGNVDSYRFEKRYIRKDEQILWADLSVSPISDEKGDRVATFGVIVDITTKKRAEQDRETLREQLWQAQKMQAIGTLAGGIAHDSNNLLTIINGYTELILAEITEDDPIYSDLQKILETGRKGADMVQRLLAFSKKGESSPQPLDLNRAVENSIALMERTFPKMIEIEKTLEKDLGMVNADAGQIHQVIMNLGINAKEAMPDGGSLRIETRNITVDEDYCRLNVGAKPGRCVVIEVSDTGTGMSKETMDRMFDPFFTTKGWDFRKGTGLGLSVVKGIMEQHSGWMTCESEPGTGTTFRVYFPSIEELPAVQEPVLSAETVPETEKILLVDDEEYVRDLGKRILERSGYTVQTAANGKEALEIYAREQSNIALVVLDLIMPHMGGEKCLDELLKINPDVIVLVSTGHSLASNERDRLGARAKGFVNKPYQIKQLLEVVRGVLDAK